MEEGEHVPIVLTASHVRLRLNESGVSYILNLLFVRVGALLLQVLGGSMHTLVWKGAEEDDNYSSSHHSGNGDEDSDGEDDDEDDDDDVSRGLLRCKLFLTLTHISPSLTMTMTRRKRDSPRSRQAASDRPTRSHPTPLRRRAGPARATGRRRAAAARASPAVAAARARAVCARRWRACGPTST